MAIPPNPPPKAYWARPVLVIKPLSETRAGVGTTNDGIFEFQS
jgi:hypothetical protein